MPRVPIAENTVGFARDPGAKVEAPDMGQAGEMIGRAVQGTGEALGKFADSLDVAAAAQDSASATDAINKVQTGGATILHTGDNPYFERTGKDALATRPDTEKSLDQVISDARTGLKNPRQMEMFNRSVLPQRVEWGVQIAGHAHTAAVQYDDQSAADSAVISGQGATAAFLDPVESRKHIDEGIAAIQHRGAINNWPVTRTQVETLKFTSGVHQDIGEALAAQGGDGPKLAIAYADRNRNETTGDAYAAVQTHARVQQNAQEAEQRRADADARRQLTEEKRDARDRAISGAANLDAGIPMAPKDFANLINDARDSGDQALMKRLAAGQFKNNLTQQYAGALPNEIESRVNQLSADITKAGTNATPEQVVERDHLNTLLDKSRTELRSDPLGYAAKHFGFEVKPLNLNDPNSIAARVDVTTRTAARTGTAPVALLPDEVSQAQNTLTHGTVQQRVQLALRLGALGTLAGPAAQQVSNNPGFNNLIGLATHGNRSVAASRVNQIVTGYEVLKSRKIDDKAQSGPAFAGYVGNALQFLPGVRDGVMSNATALMATQANEHGWNSWDEAQGADPNAWYRSINSALGAYTHGGKQIGGLATFNKGVTILPEDMSQDEFEGRIARSNGPQYRAAQNGEPVFSGGKSPTANDLKRMQWVPSGDGIYRIGDGNGFLHTKDGKFYEVDVHKLRP